MGAWTYAPDKVLGVIGYVPVEEYAFFVIQTVITCLICVLVLPWSLHALHIHQPSGFLIRYIPVAAFLIVASTSFQYVIPGTKSFYLAALLAWTGPVLALQWWVAGPFIWSLRRSVLLTLTTSTSFLWLVDHTAISQGVWQISPTGTTGIMITPFLPLEEALFFLLVNCMIVFGLLAMDRTFAIVRLTESRVGGRNGHSGVFSLLPPLPSTPTTPWTLQDEIQLWIHCTFLLPDSHVSPQTIQDLRNLQSLLSQHSKTFSLASRLYPQPLREDVIALYGFCRVSDDVADLLDSGSKGVHEWKRACFKLIREFLDTCYWENGVKRTNEVDRLTRVICTGLVEHLEAGTSGYDVFESVLRLFSQRIPRSVPHHCIVELLSGYQWDLEGKRIDTEQDLLAYSACVASSVGEACVYLMFRHDAESRLIGAVDVVNRPLEYLCPKGETVRRARDMGVALQVTNIARDLVTDACELGRVYIPTCWFAEEIKKREVEGAGVAARQRKRVVVKVDGRVNADSTSVETFRQQFIASPTTHPDTLRLHSTRLVALAQPFCETALVGIEDLPQAHRPAVKAALKMYTRIGDVVVASREYPRRAVVPRGEKVAILLSGLYL
ncbi:hypothetical protein HDU98_010630 [Podochytrium sp. JEL0797]|nr:hypothetical protein HDU98_010630 [Podochytrium sp. JEL0797]